ncbi:MAG: hypothetical protein JXA96_09875 [Sedimentisphaerales bacterium]|nr:hypothetical protein [Sedimentisphaerales bacterium]
MEAYSFLKRGLISFIITLAIAQICLGNSTIYTGSLSVTDGGLTAYGAWNHPSTQLAWKVDDMTTPGKWHYTYYLLVPSKDISHMIIEASNGDRPFTSENLFSVTSSPDNWVGSVEIQNFMPDNSTPYMPEEMYGIKFDAAKGATIVTVCFDSDRGPVWGDFYSKDGYSSCSGWNALYNTGFSLNDYDPFAPAANGSVQNHLLVPDSFIPAPGAIILVCIGTALTGVLRRRQTI